jgi:hypothetical protein
VIPSVPFRKSQFWTASEKKEQYVFIEGMISTISFQNWGRIVAKMKWM